MFENSSDYRLKYFPVTMFAIIMGLAGLTILFNKMYHIQVLPEIPYLIMLYLTTFAFFVIFFVYSLKVVKYPEAIKEEFNNKVRLNFFSTIPISLLLLSIAYLGKFPFVSIGLWSLGTISQTILLFVILSKWLTHQFDILHFNPAWFIPVVGIILIPIAGVSFFQRNYFLIFLTSGLFFWAVLSAILFYRLIFHQPIHQRLLPTFFILLAPPAVGFIAYMRTLQSWDLFSQTLLSLLIFFLIFLLFIRKSFTGISFYISWWAFSFPLAASGVAFTIAFQITKSAVFVYLTEAIAIIVSLLIIYLIAQTLFRIVKKEICVKEE